MQLQQPTDLRDHCDLGTCKGKPVGKRWSWSWSQYFHLCGKCMKKWDQIYGEAGRKPQEVA